MSSRRHDALGPAELRRLCLEAGADDVGFVSLDRPEMDAEREAIRRLFPATRFSTDVHISLAFGKRFP